MADLLGSLIDSQAQYFRTSHLLIKDGYVNLVDGKWNETKVEKHNRTAECISVSLGAFGPLQDRMLIKSIMDEMCNKQLTAEYDGTDKQIIKGYIKEAYEIINNYAYTSILSDLCFLMLNS